MSAPFVGRRPELGTLTGLVQRAIRGRAPGAALVSGNPGSGKTRLLAEVLRLAGAPRVVRMVGFEPMQPVPLAAAADLLRALAAAPGDGPALERLVFGRDGEQTHEPLRIFEAAHRALRRSGPLVIAIDDLQWVDERSLALVHYLLRSAGAAHQPLVVIAASRPSPVAATLRSSLSVDLDADHRAIVDLGPLSLEDGRALARALDAGLDDQAVTDLWRRADGSPFWLEHLLRGGPRKEPADLIFERLQDLAPDAGALLSMLAVGARPWRADDLAGLLGWDAGRVHQAARELVARGLAVDPAGAIRPAHDLIREAAAAGLPLVVRRRLHARLADWIEAEAGDDLPSLREALEHRVAGAMPAEGLAMRLVSSPQRRLLGVDGLALVASIGDALEPGSPGQVRIDRSLAELAGGLGEPALALARWERVATFAVDPDERHEASVEAARAAYRLRRPREAHAHLERAGVLPSTRPEADIARLALEAEVQLWLDHETAKGAATAARSLAAALAMTAAAGGLDALTPGARRASLAAHDVAIDGALQEDRAEDVIRLSEASARVAEGLDPESHVASLMRPAFGLWTLGHARQAETRYRRAWLMAHEHLLPSAMVEAGHGLSRALQQLGELEEARAIAAETDQLERRIGDPPRRWGNAPSILHGIELALGDTTRLRDLRDDARAEPDPHYRLAVHQMVAAWQARVQGARAADDVQAELARADESAAEAACPRCRAELQIVSAELLARIGLPDDAQRVLEAWEAEATPDAHFMRQLWGDRARAAIARARGDDAAAISLLEAVIDRLERQELVEDMLWALLDLGAALSARDRPRAVGAYTTAATTAERTGAAIQGRLAAQALRRLGVRAWRRGPATGREGIAALSEREHEVARLVSEGQSNREIADRLVLSPRTVERHVTNVLAKLGLRNRTELAALIRSDA